MKDCLKSQKVVVKILPALLTVVLRVIFDDNHGEVYNIVPLLAINDNYPKCIITKDKVAFEDIEGIHVINIIDYLLEDYV